MDESHMDESPPSEKQEGITGLTNKFVEGYRTTAAKLATHRQLGSLIPLGLAIGDAAQGDYAGLVPDMVDLMKKVGDVEDGT